ncbi:MAG TPA: NIL domain-containing protein [Dissulfurispiraceae bacterium]|nr:NIL domain-containing protein [Dissulfurispiraceae bacterium]
MKKRVKLVFPPYLVKDPILFTIAKRFDVMPNIRRARVTDTVGEMILELEGEESRLLQSIETLRSQGVEVEYIEGEIFEA